MTRDGFVFYRSFYEALKCLPPEEFKKCMVAILEYGLNGIEPETDGFEKSIYLMAKPQIDNFRSRTKSNASRNCKEYREWRKKFLKGIFIHARYAESQI